MGACTQKCEVEMPSQLKPSRISRTISDCCCAVSSLPASLERASAAADEWVQCRFRVFGRSLEIFARSVRRLFEASGFCDMATSRYMAQLPRTSHMIGTHSFQDSRNKA